MKSRRSRSGRAGFGGGGAWGAVAAALLCAGPASGAEATGSIAGTVDKPEQVTAVAAVDRSSGQRFAGKLDMLSGRFIIDNLPLQAEYDCVLDAAGARLEGVNLKVPPSDYEEEQPLSADDIATIRTKALSMNKFEDVVEIMAVEGNAQHAAVLLNKVRTTPFVNSKPGEVIWRAELWHFERPEETWTKVQDELFIILYRERIPKEAYEKKCVTFDPGLGGIRLSADRPRADLGRIVLPEAKPGIRLRKAKESEVTKETKP